jgi:predicted amidohydrolase YtcJ
MRAAPPALASLVAPLLAFSLSACLSGSPPWLGEDYALVSGGTIRPAPDAAPVGALLIEDGRVLALGSAAEMEARLAEIVERAAGFSIKVTPRRIDLAGGTAVPGLVDAHGHLESLGETLESVDLLGCKSLDELVERVAARAATQPAGSWILGRGWDQTLFPGQEFPAHGALSARVAEHPVFLERVDGHAAFVNAKALELAGLTGALPTVEGGRIVVDAAGRPTGVLVDAATALVSTRIPSPDRATRARRILAAQQALLACGLVGMHDMGTAPETLEVLRELEESGQLKLRVASYLWANEGLAPFGRFHLVEDLDAKLRVIGAKLMVDGALGSRGAALLEPYSDAPDERGLLQMSAADFAVRLREAVRAGLQPATHAIGDEGNRMVLDAYAAEGRPLARLRPRIEHAQVVAESDWPRFELLGVIPSVQPTHATSDMRWAEARLGPERVRGAYAWRRLQGPHAPLAAGSDFPVEHPSPLAGLYAARTRQDAQGMPEGGWLPDQCLDAVGALQGFTTGAAFAAREEGRRGKLLPGFAADVSVLSVDPIECEARELLTARVLATLVDGELVYSALPAPVPAN